MGLTPIKADNLDASGHGFFTRMGGHSEGIYEGLNCGAGSDDDKNCVSLNREMVSRTFDLDKSKLVSVYQVHSPDAIHVTSAFEAEPPKCDAMVTATKGLALGVLTADCAPVLFEDKSAGVVGAAHSGWRGAVGLSRNLPTMIQLSHNILAMVREIGPFLTCRDLCWIA